MKRWGRGSDDPDAIFCNAGGVWNPPIPSRVLVGKSNCRLLCLTGPVAHNYTQIPPLAYEKPSGVFGGPAFGPCLQGQGRMKGGRGQAKKLCTCRRYWRGCPPPALVSGQAYAMPGGAKRCPITFNGVFLLRHLIKNWTLQLKRVQPTLKQMVSIHPN